MQPMHCTHNSNQSKVEDSLTTAKFVWISLQPPTEPPKLTRHFWSALKFFGSKYAVASLTKKYIFSWNSPEASYILSKGWNRRKKGQKQFSRLPKILGVFWSYWFLCPFQPDYRFSFTDQNIFESLHMLEMTTFQYQCFRSPADHHEEGSL